MFRIRRGVTHHGSTLRQSTRVQPIRHPSSALSLLSHCSLLSRPSKIAIGRTILRMGLGSEVVRFAKPTRSYRRPSLVNRCRYNAVAAIRAC